MMARKINIRSEWAWDSQASSRVLLYSVNKGKFKPIHLLSTRYQEEITRRNAEYHAQDDANRKNREQCLIRKMRAEEQRAKRHRARLQAAITAHSEETKAMRHCVIGKVTLKRVPAYA